MKADYYRYLAEFAKVPPGPCPPALGPTLHARPVPPAPLRATLFRASLPPSTLPILRPPPPPRLHPCT
eukprot:4038320-Prymnesium_polylepis.1